MKQNTNFSFLAYAISKTQPVGLEQQKERPVSKMARTQNQAISLTQISTAFGRLTASRLRQCVTLKDKMKFITHLFIGN